MALRGMARRGDHKRRVCASDRVTGMDLVSRRLSAGTATVKEGSKRGGKSGDKRGGKSGGKSGGKRGGE